MKYLIFLLILISVLSFLDSCRSDKYIPDLCFEENVLPIFNSKCANPGCHNSIDKAAGYDLTNYDEIIKGIDPGHPNRSEIFKAIKGNKPRMPPVGSEALTKQEKDYIKSWIQFGAKNSSNCNSVCDTTNLSYKQRIVPILSTWCISCHNSSNVSGGVDLSSYSTVQVVAGNGMLFGAINHDIGYSPMPKNSPKLSDCKIKLIQKWIASGYPNN